MRFDWCSKLDKYIKLYSDAEKCKSFDTYQGAMKMTGNQYRIYEELKYLCRDLNNGNEEKMMHDIIVVLSYWSECIAEDKEW